MSPTQIHGANSRIIDLALLDQYQTIRIETKDGKIRHIKRQSHHKY